MQSLTCFCSKMNIYIQVMHICKTCHEEQCPDSKDFARVIHLRKMAFSDKLSSNNTYQTIMSASVTKVNFSHYKAHSSHSSMGQKVCWYLACSYHNQLNVIPCARWSWLSLVAIYSFITQLSNEIRLQSAPCLTRHHSMEKQEWLNKDLLNYILYKIL